MKLVQSTCFAVILAAACVVVQAAPRWETRVIGRLESPYNSPRISDGRVIWSDYDGADFEVFLYENGSTSQLTDNEEDDQWPQIAGDNIAWLQLAQEGATYRDPDLYRILVNGEIIAETLGLPDLKVGGKAVAWPELNRLMPSQIHYYDGTRTVSLAAEGTWSNYNPDLDDNRVVWSGFDDSGNHAYYYDGTMLRQLPAGVGLGQTPQVHGDFVTGDFVDDEGHLGGVTRYNTATGEMSLYLQERAFVTTPEISEHFMAWVSVTETQTKFYVLRDDQPWLLDEGEGIGGRLVRDHFVAWTKSGEEGGIFAYDGAAITKIADSGSDLWLTDGDGAMLVWLDTSGSDTQIVLATLVVPEPSAIGLWATLFVGFLTCRQPMWRR